MTARLERLLLLAAAVAVLTWSTVVAERQIYPAYVDGDTTWLLSLAYDLYERGGTWAGWNLSPHPNYFPEFLTVDLLRRLSSTLEGFFLGFGLVNVLSMFLVSWLGLWLYLRARFAGESRRAGRVGDGELAMLGALVATGAGVVAFAVGLFGLPLRYAFLPAYHFPPVVVSMLIAFLAIDEFDRAVTTRMLAVVALAVALMLATGVSDTITVPNVVPGLAVAALFQAIRAGLTPSVVIATIPILAAGAAAQLWADEFWNSFSGVTEYPLVIDLAGLPSQFARFALALFTPAPGIPRWQRLFESGIRVLLIATAVLLAIRPCRAMLRSLRTPGAERSRASLVKSDSIEVYLLFSPILITLAVLLLGRFADHHFLRLVIPLFHYVPLAIVMRALGWLAPRLERRTFLVGFATAALLIAVLPAWQGPRPVNASATPPLLACIERHAGSHDFRQGLGHHWQSHLTTIASGHRVLVRSIRPNGTLLPWHNDLDWYGPEATKRGFTFVVVTPRFDRAAIEERFGPPTEKLACPETGPDGPAEYAAWSPSAREPAELWVYEGEAARRLDAGIRVQHVRAQTVKLLRRRARKS